MTNYLAETNVLPNDLFFYFAVVMGLVAAPVVLIWGLTSLAKRKHRKSTPP